MHNIQFHYFCIKSLFYVLAAVVLDSLKTSGKSFQRIWTEIFSPNSNRESDQGLLEGSMRARAHRLYNYFNPVSVNLSENN